MVCRCMNFLGLEKRKLVSCLELRDCLMVFFFMMIVDVYYLEYMLSWPLCCILNKHQIFLVQINNKLRFVFLMYSIIILCFFCVWLDVLLD